MLNVLPSALSLGAYAKHVTKFGLTTMLLSNLFAFTMCIFRSIDVALPLFHSCTVINGCCSIIHDPLVCDVGPLCINRHDIGKQNATSQNDVNTIAILVFSPTIVGI